MSKISLEYHVPGIDKTICLYDHETWPCRVVRVAVEVRQADAALLETWLREGKVSTVLRAAHELRKSAAEIKGL